MAIGDAIVSASLINDSVNSSTSIARWWESVPDAANVIDPGPEFILQTASDNIRVFEVDLGASNIDIEVLKSISSIGGLGPYELSDLDWSNDNEEIIGFSAVSNISGMSDGRISVTGHSVRIDFDGLNVKKGQILHVSLFTNSQDTELLGDFNRNGHYDVQDLDLMSVAMITNDADMDLNQDGNIDLLDREYWLERLAYTYFGDSN
ncbi:MAG: hypothetical protein KDA87_24255, partial [Planctomycetales bacterium]|nr:hypothetical protein [Planctomycetales bacterium]